jgi:hypothetical protein
VARLASSDLVGAPTLLTAVSCSPPSNGNCLGWSRPARPVTGFVFYDPDQVTVPKAGFRSSP